MNQDMMQALHPNSLLTQRFWIRGDVGSAVFSGWITRHLGRLGLSGRVIDQNADCVTIVVSGPPDLLDALALGCSLGPQEVWVDEIERVAENDGQSPRFP